MISMSAIITFVFTIIAMEGITWLTHKYVMHGFLWSLHYDHHNKNKNNFLEKNDLFFIIFAIPSMSLIFLGKFVYPTMLLMPIGFGIMGYGFLYFLVHEIIIHYRFSEYFSINNRYLNGLRKAHKDHHKHINKEDAECFGMLWVPFKYFKTTKTN